MKSYADMPAGSVSVLFDLVCLVVMLSIQTLSLAHEGRELKTEAQ